MKRKILVLLIIASLILPILPIYASAAESTPDKPLYVSLGDSMTNGLGLAGYDMADGTMVNGFLQESEYAYPTLVANYFGWDLTQLATSGYRAEDAYALLTYKSENSGEVRFDGSNWTITGPVGTSNVKYDRYFAEAVVGRCEDYNYGVGFKSGESTFNGTTYYDGVAWVADQYQYAVNNADVISLALGGNNFGTFLSMTLMHQLGVQFGLNMGGLDYQITERDLEDRIAELDPEHAGVALQLRRDLEDALQIDKSKLPTINPPTNIDDFINTMALYGTYSFVGFLLGYQGTLDYIEENNPDADVIILGLNNTLHDIKIDITGDGVLVINCGKYFDCIYNTANLCSKAMAESYIGLNTYWTKAKDSDVEVIYTALAPDANGNVDWTNYEVAKSRLMNSMRAEIGLVRAQYAPEILNDEEALEKLIGMAHTVDALNAPALIAFMTGDNSDPELYNKGLNNSLYLAFRFTSASGLGCHPSIRGHQAMRKAISNVYLGDHSLNGGINIEDILLKIYNGLLMISYDNGVTWSSRGSVVDMEGGEDYYGIAPSFKLEDGELFVSYDEGATWTSLGNVQGADGKDGIDGTNGNDGQSGADGKDGVDGITPTFKVENGELMVSYDEGATWTTLGTLNGTNGTDGTDGKDGKDAVAPQLRINSETNEWEISYDNGINWRSLGVKATGDKGENGEVGIPGENGKNAQNGLTIAAIIIAGTALAGNVGYMIYDIIQRRRKSH